MIQPYALRLTDQPQVSIICGVTPNREYLRARCLAEMAQDLRGLPVEFVWCVLTDEEWNECKCKNLGAKCAQGGILIFTNCDITIPRDSVRECMRLSSDDRWYMVCLRWDEQPNGALTPNHHAVGDLQAVTRKCFEATGGFDERMTGWGYLDYDFTERCEKARRNLFPCRHKVTHHWHPRLTDEEYRAMNQKNREIALENAS